MNAIIYIKEFCSPAFVETYKSTFDKTAKDVHTTSVRAKWSAVNVFVTYICMHIHSILSCVPLHSVCQPRFLMYYAHGLVLGCNISFSWNNIYKNLICNVCAHMQFKRISQLQSYIISEVAYWLEDIVPSGPRDMRDIVPSGPNDSPYI